MRRQSKATVGGGGEGVPLYPAGNKANSGISASRRGGMYATRRKSGGMLEGLGIKADMGSVPQTPRKLN